MLDFSFSEIALIGVVALVVIGPERLPKVARTLGVIVGRVQRYSAKVRADIAREVELSELQAAKKQMEEAARALEMNIQSSMNAAEHSIRETEATVMAPPELKKEPEKHE